MSLLAAAAIEVGKAVAKCIFKFWVRDSKLGNDVTSSLLDLLGSRIPEVLDQRKVNRQFEEIGDKISESIRPLLESEKLFLDDGERIAVALKVAETINKSKLSAELLAEYNLQPAQLTRFMLAVNPNAMRDFSMAGAALYERLISEASTYVVDIAPQLPSFTRETFATMLKREDQILAKADRILGDLQRIREQLDPMIEAEHFEIGYREAIARNLDILQLIGVDVSLSNRRYRLSVGYITLSVKQKVDISTADPSAERVQGYIEDTLTSVDAALASSQRLFIRGLAGSGKTTLLQWIAVKAATKSFDGQLSGWNNIVPFYIRLRHYAQSDLPKPEMFTDFAAPAISGTMPEKWVHNILKSGRAVVLIDGVDEVSSTQREAVHTWLKDLVRTYQTVRFIVTSRPHAIEEGWMNQEAFNDAELQPMGLVDIYSFIDHWHNAVREELQTKTEKDEIELLAKNLKEQTKDNRAIFTLATTPLLCAMLCALNRERRRHLPINRIELYKACCSLLLERRDKESHVELSDYPALNYSQKLRLLEDLAYGMLQENLSEIGIERVDERFERKLMNMPKVPENASGMSTRKLFIERSGIIREPIVGMIDFTHRTFQEFLAAQATLDTMEIDVLLSNALNDQWREVIVLACGLASKTTCERIISGLITRGDQAREKQQRYHFHLLAVSCMETAIELELNVSTAVDQRLGQLVPPRDMADARALAAAGELAIKHLAKKGKYSAPITAACVHALALIGKEESLNVLEGYAKSEQKVVVKELIKAWDSFDREIYAKRILSHTLQNTKDIRLERLPSLDGIQHLQSVRHLTLYNCPQVSDLSPLANLPQLSYLFLSHFLQVSDLSPLASLPQLTELILYNCPQVSDLSPLANLPQLLTLSLYYCPQVSDLSPLMGLTSLKELKLLQSVYLRTSIPERIKEKVTVLVETDRDQMYRWRFGPKEPPPPKW